MFSRFFIDRPIFASVLSIIITLAGVLALLSLPLAQYPEITPPQVQVSITYPGASAQVVADTVAAPIEQQMNGVEGMLYMSSQSGNDGSYTLSVTFEVGTDLNTALVMVQNRVTLANPQLPVEVQQQGITIRKKTPDILQVVGFISRDGRYDNIYLSNFATIVVRDELLRIDGVSDINIFGERDYSIRVWLNPQALAARNLTGADVLTAIQTQNVAAAPGRIGQPPIGRGLSFQLPIDTLGRLTTPEQYGEIVIKAGPPPRPPTFNPVTVSSPATGTTGTTGTMGTGSGATGSGSMSTTPGQIASTTNNSVLSSSGGQISGASTSGSTTGTISTTAPSGPATPSSKGGVMASAATTTAATAAGPASSSTTGSSSSTGSSTSTSSSATGGTNTTPSSTPTASIATASDLAATSATGTAATPSTTTGGMVGANGLSGGSLASGPWPAAGIVLLRDVARIELGAQSYSNGATFDGHPAVGLAIHLLPGANALDVGDRIKQKMLELKPRFPDGVEYNVAYDTTPFIRESIEDVIWTLIEAIGLVGVVVLVFLQNWRAAVIPLIAVPVAILGTFSVMLVLGFSLNNISLFGLVLAIGIVVDDAIVVVENIERWLERGLAPREAAHKAMDEVTGPIVAIAVVLCAVFVPCAFVGGITGQFFRQFAVTITASTVFSALNSLTLSPALAAILMKVEGGTTPGNNWAKSTISAVLYPLRLFGRTFNWVFEAGTSLYARIIGWFLRVSLVVLPFYLVLLGLTYWVFQKAPTGFVPDQDQGRVIVNIQLPDSASLRRSQEVISQVDAICRRTPGVADVISAGGMSLLMSANSSNFGTSFVVLDPFDKRQRPELTADAIMESLRKKFAVEVKEADIKVFGAPPIPGLSVASGYKIMVEDRSGLGLDILQQRTDALVGKLRNDPTVVGSLTQFRSTTPQLFLDVDRIKVQSFGVQINDVNQTMQIYLGSAYAGSFNQFGRYWQVNIQAEGDYRARVEDVNLLQVRNANGDMVPLGSLVELRNVNGPVSINRYNLFQAAAVTGGVRPDVSSGDAIIHVNAAAEQVLPRSMGVEWTELMFLQIRAGNTAIYVFLVAVVFVFLALAALYESWALPLAVILVVPLCLLCSIGGVLLAHKAMDIFVQIGFIVLVGLACKNAILIVEFATVLRREGKSRREAAVEASRQRLRPILMTSFAFILGVVPLVIASGAGAEMRRSLGIAVFSGMLGVTLFGVFLTPIFFDLIQWGVDSEFFREGVVRWCGSAVLGGVLGGALGYCLANLGVGIPAGAKIVRGFDPTMVMTVAASCAGALLALILPSLWQFVRSNGKPGRG